MSLSVSDQRSDIMRVEKSVGKDLGARKSI